MLMGFAALSFRYDLAIFFVLKRLSLRTESVQESLSGDNVRFTFVFLTVLFYSELLLFCLMLDVDLRGQSTHFALNRPFSGLNDITLYLFKGLARHPNYLSFPTSKLKDSHQVSRFNIDPRSR